jgi:hypothetical protein
MSAALQTAAVPIKAKLKPPLTEKQAALERGKINEQAVAYMPALAKRLLPMPIRGVHCGWLPFQLLP